MKIRFQVLSDIHLEKRKDNSILSHPIKAKYLILAGDIGNPLKKNYFDYLKFCSDQYHKVFLITGNHEYWKNSIHDTHSLIYNFTKQYNNIHFLNNQHINFYHNNRLITIFGNTLWTWIDTPINSSDNILIKDFDFYTRNSIFLETIKKISSKHADIIITHHPPTFKLIHNKYQNYNFKNLFASNLDHLLCYSNYWICGHIHEFNDLSKYGDRNLDKIIINPCPEEYIEKVFDLD
jgi:predicted phosphohydrolase